MHEVLVNCLFKLAQEKSVVRLTDLLTMTIAVDLGHKATKQTNKQMIDDNQDGHQNGTSFFTAGHYAGPFVGV